MFRQTKRKSAAGSGHGLLGAKLLFRLLSPWLLYRLLSWLVEECDVVGVLTDLLADCCATSADDAAQLMTYVDVGFSGCALLITGIVCCKQRLLSNSATRRYVSYAVASGIVKRNCFLQSKRFRLLLHISP